MDTKAETKIELVNNIKDRDFTSISLWWMFTKVSNSLRQYQLTFDLRGEYFTIITARSHTQRDAL